MKSAAEGVNELQRASAVERDSAVETATAPLSDQGLVFAGGSLRIR